MVGCVLVRGKTVCGSNTNDAFIFLFFFLGELYKSGDSFVARVVITGVACDFLLCESFESFFSLGSRRGKKAEAKAWKATRVFFRDIITPVSISD